MARSKGEPVPLDILHNKLIFTARALGDVQKSRVALGNRIKAIKRSGQFPVTEYHEYSLLGTAAVAVGDIEKKVEKELRRLAKMHFMADWIREQKGIDFPGFALLLGVTGDLSRFPTVSKLWKFLGLHVTPAGTAPKPKKGVAWTHTNCRGLHPRSCKPGCKTDHHPNCTPDGIGTAYAPQGRVVAAQIATSIVKLGAEGTVSAKTGRKGRGGPYRAAYDAKKEYYDVIHPDWTKAHVHNAAMRYAVKMLLKHMWVEWHRRRGKARQGVARLGRARQGAAAVRDGVACAGVTGRQRRRAGGMGHGIIKCDCGAIILQCRCIEGHRHLTVVPRGCAACKRDAAPEPAG